MPEESLVAILVQRGVCRGRLFVPLLLERKALLASRPGDANVLWVKVAVADDPDFIESFELLVHELEERASEIARNAQVTLGAIQRLFEEHVLQTPLA
jgi:hypothetical protein